MASHCFVCQLPILSHQTWDTWTCGPGIGQATQSIFTDIFHEDCLHCSVCMIRLKQGNGSAKRVGNKIYCVLHFGDVTGSFNTPGEDYINKLRDFKRQSLGCAEARRKSSTTLSFAVPVQACPGQPYCSKYPHDIKPTTGYWIECRGGASPVNINEIASVVDQQQQQHQLKHQQQQQREQQNKSNSLEQHRYSITGDDTDGGGGADQEQLLTSELSIFQSHHHHSHHHQSGSGSGPGGGKPPPTPTVEAVLTRGRLERQDTIKSDHHSECGGGHQDGGAGEDGDGRQIISKDDLDLVRKPSLMGGCQQPFPNITITIVQPSSPPSSPPLAGSGTGGSGTTSHHPSHSHHHSHHHHQSKSASTSHHQYTTTFNKTGSIDETGGGGGSASVKSSPVKNQQGIQFGSSTGQPPQKSDDPFELISFEEEIYEKYFYGREHWNYFTNDEALGPVIMSLKQETIGGRDQFRVLLRTISYSLHGLVPTSAICADRYDREAVVRALGDEAGLKPPLVLGQLPSTPDELLKLDQVFVKSELKVGVIYVQGSQVNSEEAILSNRKESELFCEFLQILGDRIKLKGFDKYKGGLDTVHDLTGTESVYTCYKNIEIMFHVSTMLPHEDGDPQKLQKKRHIGNDIVCVAFLEADDALFWPGCIKSHFLHTFIVVKTSPKEPEPGEPRKYTVAVVCRDEVSAFKPYLWHQSEFEKGPYFREWLLTKIINGERASYSSPKFARMQDRTRSQMMEDIVNNLANHLATGQIPKPYRRGSWRPIGHMRPSSPLLDSVRDLFEGYDQIAKDFANAFHGNAKLLCDVVFNVIGSTNGQPINNNLLMSNGGGGTGSSGPGESSSSSSHSGVRRIYAVRAILAIRSRVFLEMLYGFAPPGQQTSGQQQQQQILHHQQNNNSDTTSGIITGSGKESRRNSSGKSSGASSKRSSITAETKNLIQQLPKIIAPNSLTSSSSSSDKNKDKDRISGSGSEKDSRKASTVSTISANAYSTTSNSSNFSSSATTAAVSTSAKTPTYLTVPGTSGSSGNVFKNAFNRLVSGSWSGWGSKGRNESMKRWQSESFYAKMDQNVGVEVPGISMCADVAKIDPNKLAQTEFTIIEFDGDTFQLLIEYLHSGSCPLTCDSVPGLICAAEHFDLPDLLQACVHHTKTHLRIALVPKMLCQLENYYWRYTSASQLVNTILTYVDPRASKLFQRAEYLMLSESMLTTILSRRTLLMNETLKFQVMLQWTLFKVTKGHYIGLERPNNLTQMEQQELQLIMNRLTRDLKLSKIPPQDLIKIVLPSKTINNDRILNTLLTQASQGIR